MRRKDRTEGKERNRQQEEESDRKCEEEMLWRGGGVVMWSYNAALCRKVHGAVL